MPDTNRWLRKKEYETSGAPQAQGFSFGGGGGAGNSGPPVSGMPESNGSGGSGPPSDPKKPGWFLSSLTPIISLATAVVTLLYTARVGQWKPRVVVDPARTIDFNLSPLEVERTYDPRQVWKILERSSLGLPRLTVTWNRISGVGGAARREHGVRPAGTAPVFYIPIARQFMERDFELLLEKGEFNNLQLHVIYVLPTWSERELRHAKAYWAQACHVNIGMLDRWSSFHDPADKSELKNDCRPGGVCLVVSEGDCDGDAFEGLQDDQALATN